MVEVKKIFFFKRTINLIFAILFALFLQIAEFDLNRIKPGLETHVKIMELVEKGELSLITMTKDEKNRFKNEYSQLCAENTGLKNNYLLHKLFKGFKN